MKRLTLLAILLLTLIIIHAADTTPWQPADFTFTITCTDTTNSIAGSGCRILHYHSNSGTNEQACEPYQVIDYGPYVTNASYTDTATCPAGEECEFTICWYWTDQVYNTESPQSHVYGVDKKKPWVDAFVYAPPLQTPGNDNWERDDFTVQVTAHDGGSGVAKCEYRVYDAKKDTGWVDSGQCTGDATIGADADREQTFTFTVTVGPDGMCSEEGRDTCHIAVRITDAVGNVNDTYEEVVSIDYTPPRCAITSVDDSSPLTYYNATENTLYYNNNWGNDSYTITIHTDDTNPTATNGIVSGIYHVIWPTTTSPGETQENPVTPRDQPPAEADHTHTYTFDTLDTYDDDLNTRPTTITVIDEAGNTGTCSIRIDRDITPPAKDSYILTAHRVVQHGFTGPVQFLLHWGSDQDNQGSGAGLQTIGVYVQRSKGYEDTNHFPRCSDAWQGAFTTSYFMHNTSSTSEKSFTYTDPSPTNADIYREGYCHRYAIRVWDNVQNYVDILPEDMEARGVEINLTAVDKYDMTREDACRVFGDMDNCNNRASYLEGKFTTIPQEQGACPGSCIAGWVEAVQEDLSIQPYEGALLYIVGRGRSSLTGEDVNMEEAYRTHSWSSGRFVIPNISVYGFTEDGWTYGLHTLHAEPRSEDRARYEDVDLTNLKVYGTRGDPYALKDPTRYPTGEKIRDTEHIIFGFKADACTPSCTLPTGGIEICRAACNNAVDAPGCVQTLSQAVSEGIIPDASSVLSACDGRPKGSIVSYNATHDIICCAGPLIEKSTYTPLNLSINAKRIVTKERLVYYHGRLVKLVVKLFRKGE